MASSFWEEDRYKNHFFCALCGGPFARLFRTHTEENIDDENLDDEAETLGEFSIPEEENGLITAQEVRENLSARAQLEYLIQDCYGDAEQTIGKAKIRYAYDGSKISSSDMRWTHVIRALIHENAREHPHGGLEQLMHNQFTYLTGRGTVREDASWADAYPTIESEQEFEDDEEEEDGLQIPQFHDTSFGFHMYEEPDRVDRKFRVGSIPFHDECWDLLDLAIIVSGKTRGISSMAVGEDISTDDLWSYLRDLIPSASTQRYSDLTVLTLRLGKPADLITRFSRGIMGNAGYREAQLCGDGRKWLHFEGLHVYLACPCLRPLDLSCANCYKWLAVSPAITPRLDEPILPMEDENVGMAINYPFQKDNTADPFWKLPHEIITEVISYLTCRETGRLRVASIPVNNVPVPQKEFRRFIKEEMAYLPKLLKKTDESSWSGEEKVDWRAHFQDISRELRVCGSLRNRRRIWKVVEPMADELVETSAKNLEATFGLSRGMSQRTAVVRGNVGFRSSAEGCIQTTVFPTVSGAAESVPSEPRSSSTPSEDDTSSSSSSEDTRTWITAADLVRALVSIKVWLDPENGHIRGFELSFRPTPSGNTKAIDILKSFGRRTSVSVFHGVQVNHSQVLTGFIVCWSQGCLQGMQLVFENAASPIDEYASGEYYSQSFGNWDGPVRRLVAPRKYRVLAGFTGFVDSFGCIETFAILEEKITGRPYDAPLTVPLSHQEASLWKRLPPNDVDLLEREGPAVGDWRTRTAECEIFDRTTQHEPPGRLRQVLGYSDGTFLTGLRFQYEDSNGNKTVSDLGACSEADITLFKLQADSVITAAVIGYGDAGVHSLQLVTPSKIPTQAFGERYLGQQKVYAPDSPGELTDRSGQRVYLKSAVIGLHCIYEPKLKRIIQLGIVCRPTGPLPPSPPLSSNTSVFEPPSHAMESSVGLLLPFAHTDNHKNYWVDGRPPTSFIRGMKNSNCYKSLKVETPFTFAGWVSFSEPIHSVTVYGDMEGIRFRYFNTSRPDSCFGMTKETGSKETYENADPKKRITCIALQDKPINPTSAGISPSLPKLCFFFTTGRRRRQIPYIEVESEYLAGIQICFTSTRLTDWTPLFDLNLEVSSGTKVTNLLAQIQHPWETPSIKNGFPSISTSSTLPPKYRVLAELFDNGTNKKVDGVKGYVLENQFCGLRFRRGGLWDVEPLGRASAQETMFSLDTGEEFTSIFVLSNESHDEGGALALCTNLGRTTPWFGPPQAGRIIHKVPPKGRKLIGIYLTFCDDLKRRPDRCDSIGILHVKSSSRTVHQPNIMPPPKSNYEEDAETGLRWTRDLKEFPNHYKLSTGVESDEYLRDTSAVHRTYSLFSPAHLERIESYVNTVPGRYGLKALKFHGDPTMGLVILGEWQDEFAGPTQGQSIDVKGANSERITAINILFHLHERGKRIIGLELETNMGQKKDLAEYTSYTDEMPPESLTQRKRMECNDNEEIAGLHYILGLYVHDMGLIVRPKETSIAYMKKRKSSSMDTRGSKR